MIYALVYLVIFWSCCSMVVSSNIVQLPPLSPGFLRVGCYNNTNGSSSVKFPIVVRNQTVANCLKACANVSLPLTFYNNVTCMCSYNDAISSLNQTTCHPMSSFQVFNVTSLFPSYGEMMTEIHFIVADVNITSANLGRAIIIIDFGDESGNYTFKINSTITHRFLWEGTFKVTGNVRLANQVPYLISRDVIIQQRVSLESMSCPRYASTMGGVQCNVIGLKGSSVWVDFELRRAGNVTAKVRYTIPDSSRVIIGSLTSKTAAHNTTNSTKGTYIKPGLRFKYTTVTEAWEILANRECLANLKIFRPKKQYSCSDLCHWSSLCKQWTFKESTSSKCNTPCLLTKQCIRNSTNVCWLINSYYYTVSTFTVILRTGYNFIPVPEHVKSISAEYGDVIGWTLNDTDCIKKIHESRDEDQEVWYSTKESNLYSPNDGDTERKYTSFAIRVHGFAPRRIVLSFCHSDAEELSVFSKFYNQITLKSKNATITFQTPILGVSWNGLPNFMVVNKSTPFIFNATDGTNITCELVIPGQTFVYSPFTSGNITTKGIIYRNNITFHKNNTVYVRFYIFNLVSRKSVSFKVVVRLKVLGLVASMTYADFAYQNALTYFNTSLTQGDHMVYHWIFENKPLTTSSVKATSSFRSLGRRNLTLYAHNSASYQKYNLLIQVIPNPVSLNIPTNFEADVAQTITCTLFWPGGKPQTFFQQQNVLGQRGTDAPETANLVLDLGDGKSAVLNSSSTSIQHAFKRNTSPGYSVQCTAANRPELNVVKIVFVFNRISGLQIKTNCPGSVTAKTKCKFQALITKGDKVDYKWTVKDGSWSHYFYGSSFEHKFSGNPNIIKVNVSNPISWMVANVTVDTSRPGFETPTTAKSTATYTTSTSKIVSPSSSTSYSSTGMISSSVYFVSSATPLLSPSSPSKPIISKSLQISPSSSVNVFPTSSSNQPLIKDATTTTETIVLPSKTKCIIEKVNIHGASPDKNLAPVILPQFEYSLSSSLNAHCESTLMYNWSIYHVLKNTSSTELKTIKDVSFNDRELVLPRNTLLFGLYKFTLTVTSVPPSVSSKAYGFLRVREPSLVAVIACGHVRTVSSNKSTFVDASKSYDPANPTAGSNELTFKWLCHGKDDAWFGNILRNGSVLHFPRKRLHDGEYVFVVEVTSNGIRKSSATQTIKVVSYDIPDLCIRCKDNCGLKTLLFKPVILFVDGWEKNTSTFYTWRVSRIHKHHVRKRSTVKYSSTFVIHQLDLIPNQTYTAILETEVNKTKLNSQYLFHTDNLPLGGQCNINPSTGKVIETSFQIVCSRWVDQDSPLWYEYYYHDSNAGLLLMSYGWEPKSPPLYLPPGAPNNNYLLKLEVQIVDMLGSRRRVPLNVTVMGFDASDGPVSELLNNYVEGPSSKLGKILLSGEQQEAFQLMTTISTVLNEDSLMSTSSGSGHTQREKIRFELTKEFSRGCCSSLPSLRQVLGGLQGATRVPKEVTPDSQMNGAKGYQQMAETLATKYESKSIDNESKGIVTGLSDILEASDLSSRSAKENEMKTVDWLDDSNSKGNKEIIKKSTDATQTCLSGADQVARALVLRTKLGDNPSTIRTSMLEIAVHRQASSSIRDITLDNTNTSFIIPDEGLGNNISSLGSVGTKVISLRQSPFLSESEKPISSHVSSLELQDPAGGVIAINNLTKPIAIFLVNNDQTEHIIGGVNECMNISVYTIKITEPNMALYLKANCSSNCSMMLRKDQRPSLAEYDQVWDIAGRNMTFKKIIQWEGLNGTGIYYLGISRRNMSNSSCDSLDQLVYNISINMVSCVYWDELKLNWSTFGCQVGPETTRYQIHCLCTHLTWFGSKMFVPPNKLDLNLIAARLSEPSNYAAVLSVICTIWVVYVLVVIWARKQDKEDAQKIGVRVSPSNKPNHNYIYEVMVTIGIRRGAGTTANTAIILYGEQYDSEPHLLTDIETHKTLQRGVTHTFLITTKEYLGQIQHIRIWHDNKGKDPALFLKEAAIRDIQTRTAFHFLCNRWFAVDEGDGMIDRVIPVTSEEEMTQFTHMFLSKTRKDLTDSHLWFSIVWRPPHSVFTRVQRVSCCLSLLLCTMMANAMWYQADKESYTKVDLGPFEFSWEQVSIGIMSSLIVFPINLFLVQIFRHSKIRKPLKIPQRFRRGSKNQILPLGIEKNDKYYRLRYSADPEESLQKHKGIFAALHAATTLMTSHLFHHEHNKNNMDGSTSKATKHKATFQGLPRWCRYIGWAGVIATTLASSAVTLMYGIQFGKRTSEEWLLSMFISVTQDIFVNQPVKVIAVAVAFAIIFKKPQINDKTEEDEEDKKQLIQCNMVRSSSTIRAPPIIRPTEDTLQIARKRKQQEQQMGVVLKDVISYLLFMLILLLIAYGQRDKSSFLQKESIESLLLRTNYSGLSKGYIPDEFQQAYMVKDMWKWLENVVLPALYNIPWYYYTGRPSAFVNGNSGVVVGVARLRQLRILKGDCVVADEMRSVISECKSPYSTELEDKENYESGWAPSNSTLDKSSSWHYNTAIQLTGFPFMGNAETYSGAGYVLNLSPIYYKAVEQIREAKAKLWTSGFSRAVFVEFNLYNPSSNLFTACIILMELLPTGGLVIRNEILTYRLYRYVGDFQLFIMVMELTFLVFIIYFTYREGKGLYKQRCKYFKESWNLIELIIIFLAWTSIVLYFIVFGIRKWTLQKYTENPTDFTNFHYISAWEGVFENTLALTVFAAFIKIIKLLSFNKRMYLLAHTIKHAGRDIINYTFIFLITFFAFSQLYYFMLGSEYMSFSTVIKSMEKLISVVLGKFNFEEFMNPFRALGAITFIMYMLVMKFFLLNILVVLIISSFQEVKHSNKKLENEFEILDFMMDQFKSLTGIRTLHKSSESNDDFEKASETTIVQDNSDETKCVNEKRDCEALSMRIRELEFELGHQYDSETFDEVVHRYVQNRIKKQSIKMKYLDVRNIKWNGYKH